MRAMGDSTPLRIGHLLERLELEGTRTFSFQLRLGHELCLRFDNVQTSPFLCLGLGIGMYVSLLICNRIVNIWERIGVSLCICVQNV